MLKLIEILYEKNNETKNETCLQTSLDKYKEWIKSNGGRIIDIKVKPQPTRESKKINSDSIEKRDYYYSKYGTEKRRLDNKRITKREFETRIEILKKLREECKTKSEFKRKYERIY